MLKRILPDVMRLLEDRNVAITFVDIGSRNGVLELRDLARFVDAYGFEPNPDEYEKLVTGRTDLFRIGRISSPSYRKLSYQRYAIGNRDGKGDFYITPGPGACGMLEPNTERLREIIWKGKTYETNLGDDVFADYRKIEIPVQTLDTFIQETGITSIDYLKIDVEGSEYDVFDDGRTILHNTGVIKVETCFIPFRRGQRLFSHVDLLLREYGFDLLRYGIDPMQVGYKERTTPMEYLPARVADPYGQALSCDAIYVNRNVTDPVRSLAQAVVLIELKYFDELHILKTRSAVGAPALRETLRSAQYYDSTGSRLRAIGYRAVDALVRSAAKVGRLVRA